MVRLHRASCWLVAWLIIAKLRLREAQRDRGDVPGWVMVTVMTAGLVVAIFAVFRDRIIHAVQDAIDSVTDGTK